MDLQPFTLYCGGWRLGDTVMYLHAKYPGWNIAMCPSHLTLVTDRYPYLLLLLLLLWKMDTAMMLCDPDTSSFQLYPTYNDRLVSCTIGCGHGLPSACIASEDKTQSAGTTDTGQANTDSCYMETCAQSLSSQVAVPGYCGGEDNISASAKVEPVQEDTFYSVRSTDKRRLWEIWHLIKPVLANFTLSKRWSQCKKIYILQCQQNIWYKALGDLDTLVRK